MVSPLAGEGTFADHQHDDDLSACSSNVAVSESALNAIRLSLEPPLENATDFLKKVDKDLAKFGDRLLRQANQLVECAEDIANTTKHGNFDEHVNTPHQHQAEKNVSLSHDAVNNSDRSSELLEKLRFLQHDIQYLYSCTDVVGDHNLMMSAGTQPNDESQARRQALEQLSQARAALKVLKHCLHQST